MKTATTKKKKQTAKFLPMFGPLSVGIYNAKGKLLRVADLEDPRNGFIKALNEMGVGLNARRLHYSPDSHEVWLVDPKGKRKDKLLYTCQTGLDAACFISECQRETAGLNLVVRTRADMTA